VGAHLLRKKEVLSKENFFFDLGATPQTPDVIFRKDSLVLF
jgi:hypothetical protein